MTVINSQGATVAFNGTQLGVLQGATPAFNVGNVHDVTSLRSSVIGEGASARVISQYNCTSIDPGTLQVRFIGHPGLARNDLGGPGLLVLSWYSGTISGMAICLDVQADFAVGALIQWSATFQFTGF